MAKLATLFLVVLTTTTLTNPSNSASTTTTTTTTTPPPTEIEFIRKSCSDTLYPKLCFASLSPNASSVGLSPLKLAQLATNLSLSRLRSTSSHLSSLSFTSSVDPPISQALRDCGLVLGNAVDRTNASVAELGRVSGANETEATWSVSNVQTWMSAALTDEETCTDGLKEADGGMRRRRRRGVGVEVGSRVGVAKEFTSNALALVNKLSAA